MFKLKITPDQALNYVRKQRLCADPNKGFLKQLDKYFKQLCTDDEFKAAVDNNQSSRSLYNLPFNTL